MKIYINIHMHIHIRVYLMATAVSEQLQGCAAGFLELCLQTPFGPFKSNVAFVMANLWNKSASP